MEHPITIMQSQKHSILLRNEKRDMYLIGLPTPVSELRIQNLELVNLGHKYSIQKPTYSKGLTKYRTDNPELSCSRIGTATNSPAILTEETGRMTVIHSQ